MSRIAILPPAVADQIAAGEVVERPASVVKELVENALDAGARSVEIAVEEGGRALIRVSDDGGGMERDDAVLALSRHATSKIRSAEELVGVASFGFRGEALPAICSVAQLEIATAAEDGAGTLVRAAGGAVLEVADAARRRGTTVSVARLFYNTPARQKFLRSARAEWRGIGETLAVMALSRPDVRFVATHDGRAALTLPPAPSLRARVGAVHGARYADALLDVDDVLATVHVSGLVERPADVGTSTRRIFLAVNGRAVREPGIVRAAEAAYRTTIPAGRRPAVFLSIVLPAEDVDVNVHPAKAEVRFRDRWAVERAVERAVRRALGTLDAAASFGGWTMVPVPVPSPADADATRAPERHAEPLPWEPGFDPDRPAPWPVQAAAPAAPAPPAPREADGAVGLEALRIHGEPAGGLFVPDAEAEAVSATTPADVVIPPLVQLRRTYIVYERDEGLVLIDQHSAHERVLYERFMGALERGDAPAQRLLFPTTLHLGTAQADAFEAHRDHFARLGYDAEPFGGSTLLIRAVPTPHPRFDAERCLRESLDALTGDRWAGVHAAHERLAATVACKAAIKAGDALSLEEMRALFVALACTTLPAHDVHGRATIVQLAWDEVERRFGRR